MKAERFQEVIRGLFTLLSIGNACAGANFAFHKDFPQAQFYILMAILMYLWRD